MKKTELLLRVLCLAGFSVLVLNFMVLIPYRFEMIGINTVIGMSVTAGYFSGLLVAGWGSK